MNWAISPPERLLTDGVVVVRQPRADDATAIDSYVHADSGLDGGWLPLSFFDRADLGRRLVEDWLAGWSGRSTWNGPAPAVTVPDTSGLIGVVGLGGGNADVIELSYGMAPGWRRRRLARRACRLVADWLVEGCDDVVVELRIARMNIYSQRVATGAGFGLDGGFGQLFTATGEVYEDLRFVYPYRHPEANGEENTNR